MSNRQARNRRKATNRRKRLLAWECPQPGFSADVSFKDYEHSLILCLTRHSDGARCGADYQPSDQLWRHLDHMPYVLAEKLMAWFERNPEVRA